MHSKRGIHEEKHSSRVSVIAMIIAKKEGLLSKDQDNTKKDMLIEIAMLHDIGRTTNLGAHARRSARKVDKLDLKYLNGTEYSEEDKKMLMAVIEGHTGKPDKIDKLIAKYQISGEKNIQTVKELNMVLRDADALDRVRLDSINNTNLNPKKLKTKTANQLMNMAYELENLTDKTNILKILSWVNPRLELIKSVQENVNSVDIKSLGNEAVIAKEEKER